MDEVEELVLEHRAPCFLCGDPIHPGPAVRVLWSASTEGVAAMLGYFHAQTCGPVMLAALRSRENVR